MKITSILRQEKDPRYFNVFIDGQFSFSANEDLIVESRLIVGKEVTFLELDKIVFDTEVSKLLERVYRLLGIRARSEKEVRDYLRELSFKKKFKGENEISEMVVESLIKKLKERGLLDDLGFARAWVESRGQSQKKGVTLLRQELFKKGINREIVEGVLEELSIQTDQVVLAREALVKKIRSFEVLPYLKRKKRMYDFLLRRGFEYQIVKEVVESFLIKE